MEFVHQSLSNAGADWLKRSIEKKSLPLSLSVWPLDILFFAILRFFRKNSRIPQKHIQTYKGYIENSKNAWKLSKKCKQTYTLWRMQSAHPHLGVHIHTLTFRLISPCQASRYSFITVQSKKGSCRQFPLNLRISILSWKHLFTRGCAANLPPPPQPSPTCIKLHIAKAKQQCITTLCDISRIREIEQTK